MRDDRREIRLLAKRIASTLESILDVLQRQVDAIDEYTHAQQLPKEPPPPGPPKRVSAELNLPPEIVKRYYAEQNKSYRLQWWTFFVTGLTFIALVIYTCFTYQTWQAMLASNAISRKSADAALSAAKTADDTLKDSKRAFVLEHRPYLISSIPRFVRNPSADEKQIAANITIENIGKTPAIGRRVFLDLSRYRGIPLANDPVKDSKAREVFVRFIEGTFNALRKSADAPTGKYGHLAREDIAPGAKPFSTGVNKTPITREELPDIQTGALSLYLTGIIRYADGFEGTYETEFCYYYFGSDPTTWHICDSHNTIK
ncbi:MAG: hypothetical protein ACKV22_33115 [Bryobacteraceae bacterium]